MGNTFVDLYFSPAFEAQPLPKITLTFFDDKSESIALSQAERDLQAFGLSSRFKSTGKPQSFKQKHYEIYNVFTNKFYRAHDMCLKGARSPFLPEDAILVGASLPIRGCLFLQDPFGGCLQADVMDQMDKRGFSPIRRQMFRDDLYQRVNEVFAAKQAPSPRP